MNRLIENRLQKLEQKDGQVVLKVPLTEFEGAVRWRQIDPLADVSLRNSRARSSAYLAAHRPAAGLVLATPAAGSTPAPPCPMSE